MSGTGMMDAAFFVGKNELLSWLNALLTLNYTKVEQCANGAAYCQIMDACYPVMPAANVLSMHLLSASTRWPQCNALHCMCRCCWRVPSCASLAQF